MSKKLTALVLALTMLVGCLVGCGGTTGSSSAPASSDSAGTPPAPGSDTIEPFTIDWYVDLSFWNYNSEGWGLDLVSKEIQERTGATINFIVPASDGGEQLSTMIASNALPDIITMNSWWDNKSRMLTHQLSQEGYLYAYNDLMAEHRPSMESVIRDDLFSWFAEKDGKTYLLPNFGYSTDDLKPGEQLVPNGCITVRKDLLEQIGNPDISTADGLFAACEKIVQEVKTYDGQNIIPIQMYEGVGNSILWLSQYFATPFEDENGNLLGDIMQPNYKEALKFLNMAYQKGYISDANFSDTRDMVNEKVASGRVFIMLTAPQDFIIPLQTLYDKDPNAVYVPFELRNAKGEEPVLQDIRGTGWLVTCVSKNTKNPAGVARLIEYLLSDEGQILTFYGKEGETFDYDANGKIVLNDTYLAALNSGDTKKYGINSMNLLQNYAFARQFESAPTDAKVLATNDVVIKTPMTKYSYDFTAAGLLMDPTDPRKEEMQQIGVKIDEYRKVAIAEMVTAKDDAAFEARYSKMVADLEAMGYNDLMAYRNDGFQNAKKALGQERAWPPYIK